MKDLIITIKAIFAFKKKQDKWIILCYLLLPSPGSNIKYPVMRNCNLKSYKDNKLASEPCIFKTYS